MDTSSKRFYRAKEAAIYLGVEVSTIWRYAKSGKLNAIKQSAGVTVFDIDNLNSLAQSKGGN